VLRGVRNLKRVRKVKRKRERGRKLHHPVFVSRLIELLFVVSDLVSYRRAHFANSSHRESRQDCRVVSRNLPLFVELEQDNSIIQSPDRLVCYLSTAVIGFRSPNLYMMSLERASMLLLYINSAAQSKSVGKLRNFMICRDKDSRLCSLYCAG